MTRRAALPVIFFVSGAAALLFETLWFRLTGLTFGNTAWASAIVLASFMSGLALGNLLSLRLQGTLRTYAVLELLVAATAFTLVFALGPTQTLFVPLFRALPLNATRLVLAFLLLIVPTTLMGATLPTVVRALSDSDANFGRVLGLLYGCNTLGAVAGSLLGEVVLIRAIGVRGTSVVAAALSVVAAAGALFAAKAEDAVSSVREIVSPVARRLPGVALLAASFLSGAALLALEVLWFRLVVLFNFASSLAFAVMLAVVLFGIGGGALATSFVMSRRPDADDWLPFAAAASAIALAGGYWGFSPTLIANPALVMRSEALAVLNDSLRLMLPVSLISGYLFTAIGRRVEREIGDQKRATAVVTCSNTIGAALGSLIASFVIIPRFGVESGFFVATVMYALVAVLTLRRKYVALAIAVVACAFFPFGLMRSLFLPEAVRGYSGPQTRIVAVREGPIETAVYLRNDFHGAPHFHRLFTNGYSMSGTMFSSKRYMSLFGYLPVALRPRVKSALLISYGVGVTAKTLTDTKQLESIDVVDISRNILELGEIAWPGPSNPLRDRRVRVHLEDGRFFMRTTDRRFDLITAEPPPPKSAGVVSLYTIDYFKLLRSRLTDNGIATYWLPVYQLDANEARSLVAAFCGAFGDCSLWSGGGGEWILAGGRGAWRAPTATDFSAQWRDATVAEKLRAAGLETPEQLAATFIADGSQLREFAHGAKPLSDDFPLRLAPHTTLDFAPEFVQLLRDAPRRYRESAFVAQAIPREIRPDFTSEAIIDQILLGSDLARPEIMRPILTQTSLRVLPSFVMHSDPALQPAAVRALERGDRGRDVLYLAGVAALSGRDYAGAEKLFGSAGAKRWQAFAHDLRGLK